MRKLGELAQVLRASASDRMALRGEGVITGYSALAEPEGALTFWS
jgi:hypothetical protein